MKRGFFPIAAGLALLFVAGLSQSQTQYPPYGPVPVPPPMFCPWSSRLSLMAVSGLRPIIRG